MTADEYSHRIEAQLNENNIYGAAKTFLQARAELGDIEAANVIRVLAYSDSAGLLTYALVTHLLRQQDDPLYHYTAGVLLGTSLCHLPRAYDAALYHAIEAATKAPDVADYHWLIHDIASSPDPNQEVAKTAREEALLQLRRIASRDERTRWRLQRLGYA